MNGVSFDEWPGLAAILGGVQADVEVDGVPAKCCGLAHVDNLCPLNVVGLESSHSLSVASKLVTSELAAFLRIIAVLTHLRRYKFVDQSKVSKWYELTLLFR